MDNLDQKLIVATKVKNYIKTKHSNDVDKFLVPEGFLNSLDTKGKSLIDDAVARRKGNNGKKLRDCDV